MLNSYKAKTNKNTTTEGNTDTLMKNFIKVRDIFAKSLNQEYQKDKDMRKLFNGVNMYFSTEKAETQSFKDMFEGEVATLKTKHSAISEQLDKFYNDTLVEITRYEQAGKQIESKATASRPKP